MKIKRSPLLVLVVLVFVSTAGAGARYASPNAEALRKAIGPVVRTPPVTLRRTGSHPAIAQSRAAVNSSRGPVVAGTTPTQIGAAHPTALRTLGGAPTGKSAIRAAIDGSVSRARPR